MTPDERFNEMQKARATYFNALSVGSIIAGGISAVSEREFGLALVFVCVGVLFHCLAFLNLQSMKVEDMFDLTLLDILAVAVPTVAALVAYMLSGHIARRLLKSQDKSTRPAE